MTIYKVNIIDVKTGIVGRFSWFYNKESNKLKKNLEKYLFEHEEIEKDWRSGWKKFRTVIRLFFGIVSILI